MEQPKPPLRSILVPVWPIYHQKRVLLIDFDSQANLSAGVGLGKGCLDAMPAVLTGEKKLKDVIRSTSILGMDAVPANIYLGGF